MTDVITHENRIVRRQAWPLWVHQWICDCGAASPASHSRDVAVIARRSHLIDIGKAGEGDD